MVLAVEYSLPLWPVTDSNLNLSNWKKAVRSRKKGDHFREYKITQLVQAIVEVLARDLYS